MKLTIFSLLLISIFVAAIFPELAYCRSYRRRQSSSEESSEESNESESQEHLYRRRSPGRRRNQGGKSLLGAIGDTVASIFTSVIGSNKGSSYGGYKNDPKHRPKKGNYKPSSCKVCQYNKEKYVKPKPRPDPKPDPYGPKYESYTEPADTEEEA